MVLKSLAGLHDWRRESGLSVHPTCDDNKTMFTFSVSGGGDCFDVGLPDVDSRCRQSNFDFYAGGAQVTESLALIKNALTLRAN